MTKKIITEKKKLTILVATHKPCCIPESDNLQLIHCGRAISKLTRESSAWMEVNSIGDNTGDNISSLNPYFCELTAIYWAWKNYDQLQSPERLGLCHYRRYFMDYGTNDEITVPVHYLGCTIREQFNKHHNPNELRQAINMLPDPELRNATEEYLNQNKGFFFNMFILKQELFFEYCENLFYVLFNIFKKSNLESMNPYQRRLPGFVAERLTGGFMYFLNKKRKMPIHESLVVVPIFNSWSKLQTQIKITNYLNSSISEFPFYYSKFLSIQTHLLHH